MEIIRDEGDTRNIIKNPLPPSRGSYNLKISVDLVGQMHPHFAGTRWCSPNSLGVKRANEVIPVFFPKIPWPQSIRD